MKKFIVILLFVSSYAFARMDSTSVRISAQDSISAYNANDIFVMQKKIGSSYKWKKMYMSQLMGIMHDSVGAVDASKNYTWTGTHTFSMQPTFIDGISVGKSFVENGYMGFYQENNSNYLTLNTADLTTIRQLTLPDATDTLATHGWVKSNFAILPSQTGNNGKYLKTNGTTLSWAAVSGGGIDTTKIGYLAKNQTWTFANIFTQPTAFNNGLWIAKTGGGASALFIPATFTNARTWYIPDETDTLAGKAWVKSATTALPSQTGNNGKYLKTNGATLSWTTASGGIDTTKIPYLAKNNTFTGNEVFGGSSTTVQFLNPPYFGALGSLNGLFYLMSSGSYYTQINATTPTANRTITFPNATGTVALTSQVPTLAGTNTWAGINYFSSSLFINSGGGGFTSYVPLILGSATSINGEIDIQNSSNSATTTITAPSATANRTITFPDHSGKIVVSAPPLVG